MTSASPPAQALAELNSALVPEADGWLYCFGGLVDVRQAVAVLVGSIGDDDETRFVVRVRLAAGDSLTLRLGPYEEAELAHQIAKLVVTRVLV